MSLGTHNGTHLPITRTLSSSASSTSVSTTASDFSIIEQDKENIQPLQQGRSASMLTKTLAMNRQHDQKKDMLALQRQKLESQLSEEALKELDDPLEPYLVYLKWVQDNYTTGTSVTSGLIPLLERITHDFKDDDYYKNEIRYFKVWLQYIKFSDNPKDIFTYLFKKKIGIKLACFYESYAEFKELQGDWQGAESLYLQGLEIGARPIGRLQRGYETFKQRKEAFGAQTATFGGLGGLLSNSSGSGLRSSGGGGSRPNSSTSKFSIFIDENNDQLSSNDSNKVLVDNPGIWTHLDTASNSKKENVLHSSSWTGQKLPQEKTNKRAPLQEKKTFTVFEDKSNGFPVTKVIKNPGKKTERYNFNFDLLYPQDGSEQKGLWELLAHVRGCYQPPEPKPAVTSKLSNKRKAESPPVNTPVKAKKTDSEISNSTTMPLKDDSENTKLLNSPTLTFFSKLANKDVLQMMNQPLDNGENEYDEYADDNPDGHLGDELDGLSDFVTETITKPLNIINDSNVTPVLPKLTPMKQNSAPDEDDELMSSPFMDQPFQESIVKPAMPNPLDINVQKDLLNNLEKKLTSYSGYHTSNTNSNKLSTFKQILKPNSSPIMGSKSLMLELDQELYCFTKELGQGGYATVYLSEKPNGETSAVKLERPSNEWEFYILKQIQQRTNGEFIKAERFIKFNDESYLIIPFYNEGTILDLVNITSLSQTISSFVAAPKLDESLTIYLTVQLIRQVLKLHSIGIIHGDIKPDNCMLDFKKTTSLNKLVFSDLILIDFGRSVDLSLFQPSIHFITDLDSKGTQDCPEMRYGAPWKFEPDYYGMANVIHTLLFGKFIEPRKDSNGIYRLSEPIRRYWQKEIWDDLFNKLLNSNGDNLTGCLKAILKKLEIWLSLNSSGCGLVNKIGKVETMLCDRHKNKKGKK